MSMKKIAMLALLLTFAMNGKGEIYKWTDNNGKTHYSDSMPEKSKSNTTTIRLDNISVTAEQQRAAQARASKDNESTQKAQPQEPSQPKLSPANANKPEATNDTNKKSCKEQWDNYDKSWACYNQYRIVGGVVRGEADQHCTAIPRPDCLAPSGQ